MEIWWQGSSLKNSDGEIARMSPQNLYYQDRALPLKIKRFPNFYLQCALGLCRSGFSTTTLELNCGARSYLAQKQGNARIIRAKDTSTSASLSMQPAQLMAVDLKTQRASILDTQQVIPIEDQVFIMTAIYLVDLQRELRI